MSLSTIKDDHSFDDWISQAEAARLRGVSRQAIAKLIQRRRLASREIAGRVVVRKSEVEAFNPLPIGRPRLKSAKSDETVIEQDESED